LSCHDRNDQIHRYLDEEMDTQERIEFETHLASCRSCQHSLTELGQAIQHVTAAEWLKAPHMFTEDVLSQLQEISPQKRNWRVPFIKYTGIAAAAVLVLGMGMMAAAPDEFALQAKNTQGLIVEDGKVIIPEGSRYQGNLVVQNGDLEVRGDVNGNVTTVGGKIYRAAGADISGEVDEVDEALEKLWYFGKQVWEDVTAWAH